MGFLNLFKRTPKPLKKPAVPFDFPFTILSDLKPEHVLSAWQSAPRGDSTPVVVVWDENMQDLGNDPAPITENVDLDAFLHERLEDQFSDEEARNIFIGAESDPASRPQTLARFDARNTTVCLAQIPTSNPWEVVRHIPFGGWNECPDAGIAEAFLKRLYDRYGAVPVTIRSDVLELVPARKPRGREAYDLAMQMYAFCPDAISQGFGTVHSLAKGLEFFDVWYFWWD